MNNDLDQLQPLPNQKWTKFLPLLIGAITLGLIGVISLYSYQNSGSNTNTTEVKPSPVLSSSRSSVDNTKYETSTKPNPQNKTQTDIYLKNPKTGEEKLFITLSDVYSEHFHNSEYHNGNLYIIKRVGDATYPSENWSDQLWKYDSGKNGQMLFTLKGLTFLVAPDESFVAIEGSNMITILDSRGNTIKQLKLNQLANIQDNPNEPQIVLDSWSSDGNNLWGNLVVGPKPFQFFQIDAQTWQVSKFDLTGLGLGGEYAFNPDQHKLAYSDYPFLFDIDSADRFKASNKKVNLFLLDLISKSKQLIDTSVVSPFKPKWIDSETLEYNNPKLQGRLTFTIQ